MSVGLSSPDPQAQSAGIPAKPTWFRGFIQGKTRIAIAWIAVIGLCLSARTYPAWPGLGVCFAGAFLRFWASGFLRKDSRPAVGGPYAWVRNPLYLGTYLMAVGIAWSIENWWFLGAVTVVFAILYHFIILDEEIKLARIFGAPYEAYKAAVPRFFPRPWPAGGAKLTAVNPELSHRRYDWEIARRNKAHEPFVTFFAMWAGVAAIAWLWQR